jgi:hypothetical protein
MLYVSRIVPPMRKLNRVHTKCKNCGIVFCTSRPEYMLQTPDLERPSMFHSRECMIEYRETHKTANAMKKRILELNKRGK